MFNDRPILLIEPDMSAARLVMDILSVLGVRNRVTHCSTEQEGLAYLNEPNEIMPCLVLLNPTTTAPCATFLHVTKSSKTLSQVPVVVLTDSKQKDLVEDCYAQGAAGYLIRSSDDERTKAKLGILVNYWSLSYLPGKMPTEPCPALMTG